jgi:hypothetical protein
MYDLRSICLGLHIPPCSTFPRGVETSITKRQQSNRSGIRSSVQQIVKLACARQIIYGCSLNPLLKFFSPLAGDWDLSTSSEADSPQPVMIPSRVSPFAPLLPPLIDDVWRVMGRKMTRPFRFLFVRIVVDDSSFCSSFRNDSLVGS